MKKKWTSMMCVNAIAWFLLLAPLAALHAADEAAAIMKIPDLVAFWDFQPNKDFVRQPSEPGWPGKKRRYRLR